MRTTGLLQILGAVVGLTSATAVSSSDSLQKLRTQIFGLGVPVTNAKRSLEFWTKTLDIGLHQSIPTIPAILYTETVLTISPASANETAGASIILMEYPNTTINHGAASGKAVFWVNDVAKVVSNIKKKGVKPMLDLGVFAMFKDPDGFVVEFMPSGQKG
jgi:hypothetical protein